MPTDGGDGSTGCPEVSVPGVAAAGSHRKLGPRPQGAGANSVSDTSACITITISGFEMQLW
jgi:hypothetical protein